MNYSPLPWYHDGRGQIIGYDGDHLINKEPSDINVWIEPEDAEFIVKACNNYEKLVEYFQGFQKRFCSFYCEPIKLSAFGHQRFCKEMAEVLKQEKISPTLAEVDGEK